MKKRKDDAPSVKVAEDAKGLCKDKAKPNRKPKPSKAPLDGRDYRNLPALKAYIDRVGAEQRNFRRFVVKLEAREHYHYDKAVIQITKDNKTIKCNDKENEPTDEELKAIEADLARATFPKSEAVKDIYGLKEVIRRTQKRDPNKELELYESRDSSGWIHWVQERVRHENGVDKKDLPWSYWGDEIGWLNMEPDGDLPLFGLEHLDKLTARIFLHEGAAKAAKLQKLVKGMEWKKHPWGDDLRFRGFSVHLGWAGGAPNPHRVDWTPFKQIPLGVEVIMVCDHDPGGEDAASYVSRAIQRRMSVIRFGDDFPPKFDLADDFPPELFKEDKGHLKYIGPTLQDCLEPATWATRDDGKLRAEFVAEWWYTVKPAKFIHQQLLRDYSAEEFNTAVAPFTHTKFPNVAIALRRHLSPKAETMDYDPGRKGGRITTEGKQVINLFQPTNILPVKGDPKPFLDFMEYLIPAESDRNHTLKWIATLIARPDIRMTYGLLLWSIAQGVGKTTLAEQILTLLVGRYNCSFPTAQEAAEGTYTGWIAFKRLAVIAEIYEGHTAKTYNRLKTIITDDFVRVNEKYEKQYDIKNFVHLFATSNTSRALKLDDYDRRWLVPGVTESGKPTEYFIRLRAWLQEEDGLAKIANWAQEYGKGHGRVLAGEHAPLSDAKRQTIEDSRSEGERLIVQLGDTLIDDQKEGKNIVLRLDKVREWLAGRKAKLDRRQFGEDGHLKLETAEKISSILRAKKGLHLPTKRFMEGKYDRFRIVANFPIDDTAEWKDISKAARPVVEVFPFE